MIVALFSDDTLLERFVLKGGNALSLVHGIGSRTSLDVDLSIENDFDDLTDVKRRIFARLREHFQTAGYAVIDEKLHRRSRSRPMKGTQRWGGYQIEFKIMEASKYQAMGRDLVRARREAAVVGPSQQRTFRVQISKFEYCAGKQEAELDDYVIYVYTPPMIAIEKFRAVCQQMPEYPLRQDQTARARDFYDIHSIITEADVRLNSLENLELFRNIFAAKQVPLALIPRIPAYREFHRPDWPAVQDSVAGDLKDFDFYFDFVVNQIPSLEALWVE